MNEYQSSNLISRSAATIWIFPKRCHSTECARRIDQDTCCHSSYFTMTLLIGLLMHTDTVTERNLKLVMFSTQFNWFTFSFHYDYKLCPQDLSHSIYCFLVCSRPSIDCWIFTYAAYPWVASNVEKGQFRCIWDYLEISRQHIHNSGKMRNQMYSLKCYDKKIKSCYIQTEFFKKIYWVYHS